jgi:hypothetical protein
VLMTTLQRLKVETKSAAERSKTREVQANYTGNSELKQNVGSMRACEDPSKFNKNNYICFRTSDSSSSGRGRVVCRARPS